LSLNILNNILEKIMKIWYFKNSHQNKSNDIIWYYLYLYINRKIKWVICRTEWGV